jgi:hypothetical protein
VSGRQRRVRGRFASGRRVAIALDMGSSDLCGAHCRTGYQFRLARFPVLIA